MIMLQNISQNARRSVILSFTKYTIVCPLIMQVALLPLEIVLINVHIPTLNQDWYSKAQKQQQRHLDFNVCKKFYVSPNNDIQQTC